MLKAYYKPIALEEAHAILGEGRGRARCVAGATDLSLELEQGRKSADTLVDVRGIPELQGIRREGERLFIGAAVTHTDLERHPLVREHFRALAQGAGSVGGPQIRNIATVGGNIVTAQPAADIAVPLFSFEAVAELLDETGAVVQKPMDALYAGPGRSTLDAGRCILTGVWLPMGRFTVSRYSRFSKRKALTLPMLNLAVALRLEEGIITQARLTAGPVGPTPLRLRKAQAILEGGKPDDALLEAAAAAASREAAPRDSLLRGSADYRKELLGTLVRRGLRACCGL